MVPTQNGGISARSRGSPGHVASFNAKLRNKHTAAYRQRRFLTVSSFLKREARCKFQRQT